jgi:uncharacterized repeat protein (TIGR03803 family)
MSMTGARHQRSISRHWVADGVLLATLLLLSLSAVRPAQAQTFTVLYAFRGRGDGRAPETAVIKDLDGSLYGTTLKGGRFDYGIVFKLNINGKETILHSFGGTDGLWPSGALIRDAAGNVYGTTADGGTSKGGGCTFGCGTVFKLDKIGKETVIHRFTDQADGANPAGLVWDELGNLYGTTYGGGSYTCGMSGCGVVFKVDKTGKYTVLYTFTGGSDGEAPQAGLVRDSAGNLYGTTSIGGIVTTCHVGCGTVFKLEPDGNKTVLYNFTGGSDGAYPNGALIQDAEGNLYGTTQVGGELTCGRGEGCGALYKLDPTGTETVLYSFRGQPDGENPTGGVVRDSAGNLYGTTAFGGNRTCLWTVGCGTVFKVDTAGHETALYNFSDPDGSQPSGLMRDAVGALYGTTAWGGKRGCLPYGCGVVFKLTPR